MRGFGIGGGVNRSARVVVIAVATVLGASGVALGQEAPIPPAPGVIAEGVSIDRVPVGGLTRSAARRAVLRARVAPRRRPLVVTVRSRRMAIDPVAAGYKADVDYAVTAALLFGRAREISGPVDVPLRESLNRVRLRAIVRAKARRAEIAPRDASISFAGTKPVIRKARLGLRVREGAALRTVERALLSRRRSVYRLPTQRVRPALTSHPPAILIERDRFRLTLFSAGTRRSFPVAVGQPAYPTPFGNFHIVTKQRNPTWFPPNSPWAAGIGPVSPGPGNPLGTRWMGTSATAIGIHGTPVPSSLGTRASHGCIRMSISDAEYLYDRIGIGTPVYIR